MLDGGRLEHPHAQARRWQADAVFTRLALLVLAAIAFGMGLLMVINGEVARGVPVLASAAGPLSLERYLAHRDRRELS